MALSKTEADRARSVHLFSKVSEACLPSLVKSASMRYLPTRTILFGEGDRATAIYSLIHGSVELFSEPNGRRSTIAIIRSVKPFVLTSLSDDINPMAARTLERSEILLVPLKVVHELIDLDPSFGRVIMYELANELRELIEDFKNHRLRTTTERLAEWILRSDHDSGSTGHFVIPYGKRVLASHLGMAPENLSRNLASLAPLGVAVRGRHVSLSDRAALAQFARVEDHPAAMRSRQTSPGSDLTI
jgi:CRP/FNR family transcriptional regulator, transcriptional activator FtrB